MADIMVKIGYIQMSWWTFRLRFDSEKNYFTFPSERKLIKKKTYDNALKKNVHIIFEYTPTMYKFNDG